MSTKTLQIEVKTYKMKISKFSVLGKQKYQKEWDILFVASTLWLISTLIESYF